MVKHLYSVFIIWFLATTSVQAQSYIRDYTYKASDADSKITSRTNALDQVKLILLQEIGTHIRQEINITKDGSGNSYASEDVEAITAGLTKVEIIDEKWNGETYYLKAKIDADTERVLNALEEFKKDKSEESQKQHDALKANQYALTSAREEIFQLKIQLSEANSQTDKEKIVVKYMAQIDQLSISDMFDKGYNYYQQGQFEDAAHWFRKAAEQGDAVGQYNLGFMYENGRGVKQNYVQAVHLYRKAAEQGYANAQTSLGAMYMVGFGVKEDDVQAVHWYRKAAEQGNALGQVLLGDMYKGGYGVKQNYVQAVHLYRKAVEQGFAEAQATLGYMYELGRGVKQDDVQAVHLYRKAAEQGNRSGQRSLGRMYENGRGVKQDDVQATYWFRKLAE